MAGPVIFLSTCEFSGDMHGEVLIEKLRERLLEAKFYGVGGSRMAAAGMDILFDPTTRSTIGFIEALKNLRRMSRLLTRVVQEWEVRRPDLMIWLDSGGFNLPLALQAKRRGIPVVCMFSPSAWAYGQDRAVKLADRVELLLAVLPFEADFYRKFGTNVTYVGHPLIDRVRPELDPVEYRQRLKLTPGEKLVALLPGSRRQEIERLLPPMLEATRLLEGDPPVRWVLPVAASLDKTWLEKMVQDYRVPVTLITSGTYDLLAAADGAVISSGTATLEAAILNTPMVVVYRLSKATLWIYKRMEAQEHKGKPLLVGLPNLIMGREIVPEVLQENLTPEQIAFTLGSILKESNNRRIREELAAVRERIGPPGVMERAAALIGELITKTSTDNENQYRKGTI